MSQPVLWAVHIATNKCRSIQLLGHHIIPIEIYHLINCVHYLLYFHVSHTCFVLKEGFSLSKMCTLAYLTALNLYSYGDTYTSLLSSR